MSNLYRKVGEMGCDGLVSGLTPPVQVHGGIISKLATEANYTRGTIFAKSATDHKLYILGSTPANGDTLTPDCILCDDIKVGTAVDISVAVYTAGCIDFNKVAVKSGYTITEADKDKLRERGIVFKASAVF